METAHELESVCVTGERWGEEGQRGWKSWFAGSRMGCVFSLPGEIFQDKTFRC